MITPSTPTIPPIYVEIRPMDLLPILLKIT